MTSLAPRNARFAAFVLIALAFLGLVKLGMLVPLYAGLLSYSLILALAERWTKHPCQQQRSRWLGVAAVAAFVVVALLTMATGLHLALRDGHGVQDLMHKMGDILASARAWLPLQWQTSLPEQQAMLQQASIWLKEHAAELGSISFGAVAGVGYALIGILLGALIAVNGITGELTHRPLSLLLLQQVAALRDAFWHLICWPFSHARVDAFFDAFERLQDLNANRAIGNMAPLIVPLDRRLTALELRVDRLEQRDRANSEP